MSVLKKRDLNVARKSLIRRSSFGASPGIGGGSGGDNGADRVETKGGTRGDIGGDDKGLPKSFRECAVDGREIETILSSSAALGLSGIGGAFLVIWYRLTSSAATGFNFRGEASLMSTGIETMLAFDGMWKSFRDLRLRDLRLRDLRLPTRVDDIDPVVDWDAPDLDLPPKKPLNSASTASSSKRLLFWEGWGR